MVALLATKFVICGLVAIAHAGILQLPLQVQHDIDDSVLPSGNVPLGRPVKVKFTTNRKHSAACGD